MAYSAGRFSWDDGETSYPGYSNPAQHWNGWAMPHFTKATAARIAAGNNRARRTEGEIERVRYDSKRDAFLIDNPTLWPGEPPEVIRGEDVHTEDGVKHLYAVGAAAWTWTREGGQERRRGGTSRRRARRSARR
jgi:hypothetical protein